MSNKEKNEALLTKNSDGKYIAYKKTLTDGRVIYTNDPDDPQAEAVEIDENQEIQIDE